MSSHFNNLTPEQLEALSILSQQISEIQLTISKILQHVKVPQAKKEPDKFSGVFTSVSGDKTLNIFKMQIKSSIDLEAMQLNWRLPPTVRAQESFPVCRQTIPVLVVDDQQQVKSDLATIRFACQEEGYGLDAVRRLEKILTEPNATSQIVWAKKEEIERAKQLGGSFNVWITRYSDMDTAMLLPPQEMVQKRSSLERAQKTKIDFPPPM